MVLAYPPRSGGNKAAGFLTPESFVQKSMYLFNYISLAKRWGPQNWSLIQCLILVDAAEIISKLTVGEKETHSFVLVSISVIIEGLFDFHDFLLYPAIKRSGISLFLWVPGCYAGL
jgi:hypothetical protein